MLTALFALLLAGSPAVLHDHLLARAAFDVDADGKPDEIRILSPGAELHTGEPMCMGCPPESFVAGRFVADVQLTASGRTVRTPIVFDPEEPDWSLKRYGHPGARETLRFPYRAEPANLEVRRLPQGPLFNLVQFLGAGDPEEHSQYSLFVLKPDGSVARLEEDESSITAAGDVLAEDRLQWVWAPASPPPTPASAAPRPVCRWDEAAAEPPAPGRGYSLCVFGETWYDLGLGYEADAALEKLGKLEAGKAIACFGSESIASFDWDAQRLTLTREATGRLIQAMVRYDSQAERKGEAAAFAAGERKLKDLMDRMGLADGIEMDLRLRAFQVRVDGRPFYGGIFLDPTSQMGIRFPVARVDTENDCRVALNFLPVHLPFVMQDPVDATGSFVQPEVTPVAQEDMRSLDEQDHTFTKWIRDLALSPEAAALRRLLRDPSLRRGLEETGKSLCRRECFGSRLSSLMCRSWPTSSVQTWLAQVVLPARFPGVQVPEVRSLKEMQSMLEENMREWARREKEEAWQEGAHEMLLLQMEARFGLLPEEVRRRIQEIRDAEELKALGKRLFSTSSLSDLRLQ